MLGVGIQEKSLFSWLESWFQIPGISLDYPCNIPNYTNLSNGQPKNSKIISDYVLSLTYPNQTLDILNYAELSQGYPIIETSIPRISQIKHIYPTYIPSSTFCFEKVEDLAAGAKAPGQA